jgi:transposase
MLGKEDFVVIQALVRRGVYLCDIARQLGVHPKTVRRALERGEAPAGRRGKRAVKLRPYQAEVDRLLAEGVWNGVVILRELQARGYKGGVTILRDYIRPKRVLRGRVGRRCASKPPRASSYRATGVS